MRYCGNCGKPVNENADYCLNCGSSLINTFSRRFCPNCGNPVNPNADICVRCGISLRKTNSAQSRTADSGTDDLLDIGLIIVSILFPLIGFIIGAVIKSDNPVKASKCIKAASISVGVQIVAIILIILFLAGIIGISEM